jgi:rhodanese-related sulfurtransferase
MSTSRILEWAANTISIVAATVIVAVVVRDYVGEGHRAAASAIPTGQPVAMRDVMWSNYASTVVIVASVNCKYCSESAPLYRELLKASEGQRSRSVHVLAVFPESEVQVKAYLAARDLQFTDVRFRSLAELHVQATPTVILVDRTGIVRGSWTGVLSSKQEADLFSRLQLTRAPAARQARNRDDLDRTDRANASSAEDYLQAATEYGPPPIVDIRERALFSKGHVNGALNIPLAELEVRARHELPKSLPIFIYCRFAPSCEAAASEQGTLTHCALAQYILAESGFTNARFLSGNLLELAESGVTIAGSTTEEQ